MNYQDLKNDHHMTLVYVILSLVFVCTIMLAMLTIYGYRWNLRESHIESYGVLQVKPQPINANIKINNRELGFLDGSRLDLAEGGHDLVVSKTGYHDWSDRILVKGGKVKWINIRLFPIAPQPSLIKSYTKILNSYDLPKTNLILQHLDTNLFELLDVSNELKPLTIRLSDYFASADTYNFEFVNWTGSELIFQDRAANQTIIVNHKQPQKTIDITAKYRGYNFTFKNFKATGERKNIIYTLENRQLHRLDIATEAAPEMIFDNVEWFDSFDENKVVLVQAVKVGDQAYKKLVLYEHKKQSSAIFGVFNYDEQLALNLQSFEGKDYLVTARDKQLLVVNITDFDNLRLINQKLLKINPKTDFRRDLEQKNVMTVVYNKFFDKKQTLIKHDNARFVIVELANDSTAQVYRLVYDLENEEAFNYQASPKSDYRWFNNVILWSKTANQNGINIEYVNGNNQLELPTIKPAYGMQFDQSGDNIYYLTSNQNGGFDLEKMSLVAKD